MVFKNQIRYSPRRRASPCIAEGFSPTARAVERIYCSISIISVYTLLEADASRDPAAPDRGQRI